MLDVLDLLISVIGEFVGSWRFFGVFARKPVAWLMVSLCLFSLLPARAGAWGREGHRVIARIAVSHLTAKTKAAIGELLQADPDDREMCSQQTSLDEKMACVSTWADVVKRDLQFACTASLHFVNIPIYAPPPQRRYDARRDCANGDCVVGAIDHYRPILTDTTKRASERALALKFIVHFIGDLHQPLHTAKDHDLDARNTENHNRFRDSGDRGGNLKLVTWLGEPANQFGCWNLHAVWDDGIIDQIHADETALANALDGALDPQKIAGLQRGTLVDWVNEAFGLAIGNAYHLPNHQGNDKVCEVPGGDKRDCDKYSPQTCRISEVHYRYHLGKDYFSQNLPAVKAQLTGAGVRLAKFLNDIFDPVR